MKNNDFSKIIILILLNSFVSTQEIKQIVNNPMPNHQLPEIQSIDFPEIQSNDLPPIQTQSSDTNIILSKANKVIQSIDIPVPSAKKIIEQTRDTASNIKIPVANTKKVERLKFGLGFEFHMFPSAFVMEQGSPLGVYVPIETSGFLIEPALSYYSITSNRDWDESDYDDYESISTNWSLVVGAFKLFEKEKLRFYAGARIGKSWSTYEETDSDDEESDATVLAPTVGVEYFISDNFSFGGEGMYSMISSENEEDEYTRTTKLTTLIPTFIVRFYF